ncbi:MAG: GxxExxY protein [bacterium]
MKEEKIIYRELSYKVVGSAMEVHRELGYGFLESVYDEAFGIELERSGLYFEYQKELPIFYKGKKLEKQFRADYLIEKEILVENKATNKGITEIDEAQVHNYLKATGLRLGIIINYGLPSLEYKRIIK